MLPTEVARLFFFGEAAVEGPSSRMSSAQHQQRGALGCIQLPGPAQLAATP